MEPIIKLENMSFVYNPGRSNETWVLKDISLEIYPQEYVIFFGPSGCGKSTLLYIIAGLEKLSGGKIFVDGKNLNSLSEKELIAYHRFSIGMIFQAYYLIPSLNIKDNILLPQIFAQESSEKRVKKAKVLMERFGLSDFYNRMPNQLSGGQQQRVAIARSLINDPSIILADEPVGNLDSKNAEIFLDLLSDLNQKDKKTVIHVTHDARQLQHANRVFHMKDGKITKVITNPEKQSLAPDKMGISELERLAQAHPYLNDSQLKAKLILNHLLFSYGIEEQERIERTIDSYLLKKIDQSQMLEILDRPSEKGGAGLYTQTAQSLAKKIVTLAEEIAAIEKIEESETLSKEQEETKELRRFLLDNYSGSLSFEQIEKLEHFLSQRINQGIDKEKLERSLDRPLKEGGVGLNRRTAKKFVREIELILLKK